jgi:hypothetical protein
MAKLGQIEAVAKDVNREADTFDMLGETFEVAKRPSLVDSLMSAAISADTELSDAERFSRQIDLAHKVLKKCLSDASYARFLRCARKTSSVSRSSGRPSSCLWERQQAALLGSLPTPRVGSRTLRRVLHPSRWA